MHIDDLAALMERYRQGRCSPEEKQIIVEWYEALQAEQASDTELKEEEITASMDRVFGALRQNLPGMDEGPSKTPMTDAEPFPGPHLLPHKRPFAYKRLMAAAAVVALALGLYWAYQSGKPGRPGEGTGKTADEVVVTTVSGEVRKMVLADGSAIQLNANSTIRYSRQFGAAGREVTLENGEAFFQVAKDPAHPFVVKTGDLRTQVLGTAFDIRSYGRDSGTVIALVTGKVQVSSPNINNPVVLAPHDLVRYGKTSGILEKGHFDKEAEVDAWKERAMDFRDASFDEIAFEIDNIYNVPVINRSSRQHWSYTGYFGSENVWEVIKTICITENLNYQFIQGHIILTNKY